MKIINRNEAAALIKDHSVVYVGGFGAYSSPDELMHGLAENYCREGHPKALTVISGICSGYGNMEDIGHNILCEPGLVDTIIAGHFMISGKMSRMVSENKVAAFAPPLGAIANMLRAGASGQPGVLMKVGLGTYVDPEVEGCAVNELAKKKTIDPVKDCNNDHEHTDDRSELIKHVEVNGEDYLFYKALRPDACLIRGTIADEDGNISLKREGVHEYQLETAMAAKNNGGIVIVQVEEVVGCGSLDPKEIRIPGMLVDYVTLAGPGNHMQICGNTQYDPAVSAEKRVPAGEIEPMPLDVRKVIARRAAMELAENERNCSAADGGGKNERVMRSPVVNLGIGLPAGIGSVINEGWLEADMILSLETGPVGGVPLGGPAFAGAVNHDVLMNAADTFAFYDGGGLDIAFLGSAEADKTGNVNVSKFGNRCAGPGGFINITQNTPVVCFLGTFTAGKQEIRVGDGRLTIVKDGDSAKFVDCVQQITFSGGYAEKTGQKVLYITERAVFELDSGKLKLIEIAPGVELEKDILAKMEFEPVISDELKEMDVNIFR